MESCYNPITKVDSFNPGQKIIMHSLYLPKSSPWFDLRVFYVRMSNCEVNESTPDHLTLNHIPLTPNTILEVNGQRSCIYSDGASSLLRRDRIDKRSEEVTFVSTDSIRMTGSVRFEVYNRDALLLAGVLKLCSGNGLTVEPRKTCKKWSMDCHPVIWDGLGFLKGKHSMSSERRLPTVEVYVAGCFSGSPIILTKTLKLAFRKKHQMKVVLDSIPEHETAEFTKNVSSEDTFQLSEYEGYQPENDVEVDYNSIYSRAEYIEGQDGELSWFNAGVRVGVGIGLGICLGLGVGVGLLARTYQATTRNFKRRLF
ncbi:uncharacterized protein At1g01500 [Elaeis guineensis]|uniref:Uncharacterized protein At1g01500 n=1 Tax=Elaeis guineensis var. tenera TaxID=51953 RepID=A0A6I9S8K9_ELAGV|nr:uncharacterized protein At1g01500 [Elaeis guineensis]XP_010939289.1 uncharacterized protein At1g01500 [Elaeis guineensis]XP_010939290.1 uncharacterized protein At1g01500 [Elaeis guineensis]